MGAEPLSLVWESQHPLVPEAKLALEHRLSCCPEYRCTLGRAGAWGAHGGGLCSWAAAASSFTVGGLSNIVPWDAPSVFAPNPGRTSLPTVAFSPLWLPSLKR